MDPWIKLDMVAKITRPQSKDITYGMKTKNVLIIWDKYA